MKEKKHFSVTKICITAVFMALTCIATMVVQIPIPLGYAHLGDSVILITAFFFGPLVGALAAGIGSALADILTGFAIWAAPTLLIKTIMPLIACIFFRKAKVLSIKTIIGAVGALIFMVIGYTLFGAILYGSLAAGLASAPGLSLKAVVNLIVFIVLGKALETAGLGKIKG